jgi:glyoxylase-like metal-dependent hydrolase (beta-lactamase superfamily II)
MDKRTECVIVGPIETNCWFYQFGNETSEKQPCIVIDPGDDAEKIISALKKLNWVPRYIFLTHGHWDHHTALPDLFDALSKSEFQDQEAPEIYIHRLDVHHLKNTSLSVKHFEEGDVIGPLKILHTPGHTQGCVCFYDETAGILFTGDTLFEGDHGRTDLPGGSEEQIYQSLKRLLSLNGETVVHPGHGPSTIIKEEIANLPG